MSLQNLREAEMRPKVEGEEERVAAKFTPGSVHIHKNMKAK